MRLEERGERRGQKEEEETEQEQQQQGRRASHHGHKDVDNLAKLLEMLPQISTLNLIRKPADEDLFGLWRTTSRTPEPPAPNRLRVP